MIHDECAGVIYKFTSPSGKSYIGQTIYPIRRYHQHKRSAKYGEGGKFNNAIRKYGIDNFSYEILFRAEEHDQELLDKAEIYYIGLYDSFKNGYNEL